MNESTVFIINGFDQVAYCCDRVSKPVIITGARVNIAVKTRKP
jgi:hypothetical protein